MDEAKKSEPMTIEVKAFIFGTIVACIGAGLAWGVGGSLFAFGMAMVLAACSPNPSDAGHSNAKKSE